MTEFELKSRPALLAVAVFALLTCTGCATKRMWSHLGYSASSALSAQQVDGDRFHVDLLYADESSHRVEFPGDRGTGLMVHAIARPKHLPADRIVPILDSPTDHDVYVTRGHLRVLSGGQYAREYRCPRAGRGTDLAMIGFVLATPVTVLADIVWTPTVWTFNWFQRGRH